LDNIFDPWRRVPDACTQVAADVAALDAEEHAEMEAAEEAKAKAKEKQYLGALVRCVLVLY